MEFLVFQTDVVELVKTALSIFISGYYPEDPEDKEEMQDAWSLFLEDFEDDNCYGCFGYKKEGSMYGYYNDDVITDENKSEAVKHSIYALKNIITEDVLSDIARYMKAFNIDSLYTREELDPEFSISSDGLDLKFNYGDYASVPMMRVGKDSVSMLHISVTNTNIRQEYMDESYNNCIRYNLIELSKDHQLKKKYSLYLFHFYIDPLDSHITVQTMFEMSTDKDHKVKDMVEKEISDRLVLKFMPSVHSMIF